MSIVNDDRGTRVIAGLSPTLFDKITVAYPDSVTEVYTFTLDAHTVGVVTLIFTDSTKANLSSAERTS